MINQHDYDRLLEHHRQSIDALVTVLAKNPDLTISQALAEAYKFDCPTLYHQKGAYKFLNTAKALKAYALKK